MYKNIRKPLKNQKTIFRKPKNTAVAEFSYLTLLGVLFLKGFKHGVPLF